MPLYSQTNKCMNLHANCSWRRFDPIRSDSNFPSLFCSLRCEREWVANWLANLGLADVFPPKRVHVAAPGSLRRDRKSMKARHPTSRKRISSSKSGNASAVPTAYTENKDKGMRAA